MTADPSSPAEALAAVRRSREAILEQMRFPWWVEAAQALGAGVLIAGLALPGDWSTLVALGVIVGTALWYRAWSNRTGLSLFGIGRGRARWVSLGLGAVLLILFVVSFRLEYGAGLWWAPLPAGVLAALATYVASRLWFRAYRADLREGR